MSYGDVIEKSGKKINDHEIEWTIDVNQALNELNNASVQDIMPSGLSLIDGSVTVNKLVLENNVWVVKDALTIANPSVAGQTVTFELGDIGRDAVRIVYRTLVKYDGDYQENNSFTNEATLFEDDVEQGEASTTVEIKRDPILSKSQKSNVSYDDKTITWTILVNEAGHPLGDVTLRDVIPEGLKFVDGSITIEKISGDDDTANFGDIDVDNPITITGIVGTNTYKVTYITEITDFEAESFVNKAGLSGTGVGEDVEDTATSKPAQNSASKSFVGIDYAAKTITWKLTVDPIREALSSLKITDTYPNKGMTLVTNSFVVTIGGVGKTIDTDYTVGYTEGSSDYKDGFVLEFKDVSLPINAKVEITFKTSFDPKDGIDPNTSTNRTYNNKASFEAIGVKGTEFDVDRNASTKLNEAAWFNGKKLGRFIHEVDEDTYDAGWVSGYKRLIEWELYTNYLNQDYSNKEMVIADTLAFAGEILEDSIELYKYEIKTNGSTALLNKIDEDDYPYVISVTGNEFTITFEKGYNLPVAVVFKSTVPNESIAKYENNATVTIDEGEALPYKATLDYKDYDKFIEKAELVERPAGNNNVLIDDELEWKLVLNKSLSVIDGAEVVDEMSKGLVLIEDSIRVTYKQGDTNVDFDEGDYTITVEDNEIDGSIGAKLKIVFNVEIDSIVEIVYSTIVVVDQGSINNTAGVSGDVLGEEEVVVTEELTARKSSFSGGTSSALRASIVINKIDADTEVSMDAEFELFYLVNGVEKLVERFETENGTYEFENLTYRTYYLREVDAPTGYVVLAEPIEIDVDSETVVNRQVEVTVFNQETLILDKEGALEEDKEYFTRVGDLIDYTITVTNKGEETIRDIEIIDAMLVDFVDGSIKITVYQDDGTVKETDVKNGEITLEAGDYAQLVGQYAVTQADIDEGLVENKAYAEGTYREDDKIKTEEDEDEKEGERQPAIQLKKLIVDGGQFENVGDVVHYEFIATNIGNVALYKVEIEDDLVSNLTYVSINGVAISDPNNIVLEVGDVLLARASYTITQADIEAGKVLNHARVTGEDDEGEKVDDEDDADIDGKQVYDLEFEKTNTITTSTQEALTNFGAVGDEIHYVLTAINTGNMIAHNVVIDDAMMSDLINIVYTHYNKSNVVIATYDATSIVPLVLDPLDKLVMEATYVITEKDLEAGKVLNAASVEYTDEEGEELGDEDDYTDSFGLSKLVLLKVDAKDVKKVLAGAEFVLTNTKTKQTWTLTTDEDGLGAIEALEFGVYTLEESKAPEGYSLPDVVIEIVIDEDENGVIQITVENILEIPEMGDTSYHLAAFSLLLLGLMLIIMSKEKKAK
ncbi:MAG: hypothetical protein GX845_02650 [Erysipelothrix sp.]|nr:hypothetical protein [Erysipelothrix sp.]